MGQWVYAFYESHSVGQQGEVLCEGVLEVPEQEMKSTQGLCRTHLEGCRGIIAAVAIAISHVACFSVAVAIPIVARLIVWLIAALALLRCTVPIAIVSTAAAQLLPAVTISVALLAALVAIGSRIWSATLSRAFCLVLVTLLLILLLHLEVLAGVLRLIRVVA